MSTDQQAVPGPDADLDALVAPARDGDPAAREELLRQVRHIAHRYCRARLAGPGFASADDAAQEVCLAVIRGLDRYEARGVPFVAWVYGIAARKVADAGRSAALAPLAVAAVPEPEADATVADPLDVVLAAERSARVTALLATLPHAQREIVVLRLAVGLTARETATVLGMSEGAVRVAQHRALQALRARVGARPRAAERRAS